MHRIQCIEHNAYNSMHKIQYAIYKIYVLLETRSGQTDRQTNRPTNRPTDIVTYRAAIAAKKMRLSFI